MSENGTPTPDELAEYNPSRCEGCYNASKVGDSRTCTCGTSLIDSGIVYTTYPGYCEWNCPACRKPYHFKDAD